MGDLQEGRKGKTLEMISKYDCEGKIADKEKPNMRRFEMQSLKEKTPKRMSGNRG